MPEFLTKTLSDALASGEYKKDSVLIGDVTYSIVVNADGSDVLLADTIAEDHYQCPGCRHSRVDFTIIDCRDITDPTLEGQKWFCDGCHTFMVFEAGKTPSLYEKLATDVNAVGGSFKNRMDFIEERVRRKFIVNKAVDDITSALTDAMQIAPNIHEIDNITDRKIRSRVDARIAKDYLLQRRAYDGILITQRSARNMPMSLWLELHNAPASFVNKFKGLPRDFEP